MAVLKRCQTAKFKAPFIFPTMYSIIYIIAYTNVIIIYIYSVAMATHWCLAAIRGPLRCPTAIGATGSYITLPNMEGD